MNKTTKLFFLGIMILSGVSLVYLVTALNAFPPIDYENHHLYMIFNNNSAEGENDTRVCDLSYGEDSYENHTTHDQFCADVMEGSPEFNSTGGPYGDGAFEFDGNDAFSFSNPSHFNWSKTDGMSASAWIKINDDASSQVQAAIAQDYGGGSSNEPFWMGVGTDEKVQCKLIVNSTSYTQAFARCNSGKAVQDVWKFLTCVWNGTSLKMYSDGTLCATDTTAYPVTGDLTAWNNGEDWMIGRSKTSVPARRTNGSIDDVFIWNRVLSDIEIETIYDDYEQITECNSTLTAEDSGCRVLEENPTTWNDVSWNFSKSVSVSTAVLNIINGSDITFNNSNSFQSRPLRYGNININDSTLTWDNAGDPGNSIYLNKYSNMTVYNSIFNNVYLIKGGNDVNFWLTNITVTNATYGFFASYYSGILHIHNSTFNVSNEKREGIKYKADPNAASTDWEFVGNTILDSAYSCGYFYGRDNSTRFNGLTMTHNVVNTCGGHGLAWKHGDNAYVAYNNVSNTKGYLLDSYGQGNHHLVEYNRMVNGTNGLMFSMGAGVTGGSTNMTSRWNEVYNLTSGYAIYFNTVNGAKSENDYVEGGTPTRCFSTVRYSDAINFTNGTCVNAGGGAIGMHVSVNSSNVIFDNINLTNVSRAFFFNNFTNVLVKDSLQGSTETHEGYVGTELNTNDLNLSNVDGWHFYGTSLSDLNFTLTKASLKLFSSGAENNFTLSDLSMDKVTYPNGTEEWRNEDLTFSLQAGETLLVENSCSGEGSNTTAESCICPYGIITQANGICALDPGDPGGPSSGDTSNDTECEFCNDTFYGNETIPAGEVWDLITEGASLKKILRAWSPTSYDCMTEQWRALWVGGDLNNLAERLWKFFTCLIKWIFRQPASLVPGGGAEYVS